MLRVWNAQRAFEYGNGSTDRESLPANTLKWGGEFLLYLFSLVVIFIDTRK